MRKRTRADAPRNVPSVPDPLSEFLAEPDSLLLTVPADGTVAPGKRARVGIRVRDRQQLRSFAVPPGLRSAFVGIRLDVAHAALTLAVPPDWPPAVVLRTRRLDDGGGWLMLRLERPLPVARVVAEVARQA